MHDSRTPSDDELLADVAMLGSIGEMISPVELHGHSTAVTPVRNRAIAAIMAIGCVALLMQGIQPLVLGALEAARRLSIPEMGLAATLETLVLGGISALFAARVSPKHLRRWGLAACVLLVAASIAGTGASSLAYVATRGVAGAGGGIVVWIGVAMVTRRQDASRINAVFLALQALTQGAVAALIPVTVGPSLGANSALWILAALSALAPPLLVLVPSELSELPPELAASSRLRLTSIAGLFSAFLMMAGIVGLWIYVQPIGTSIHVPDGDVSLTIAASLAAQVVGALVIVAAHRWVKPAGGLLGVAAAFVVITVLLGTTTSETVFVAVTLVSGLLTTFALTLFLPLLLMADPTRQAAMYCPAACLFGSATGPLLAGAWATDTNIAPALVVAAALFVLSTIAVVVSAATRPPGLDAGNTAR